MWYPSLSVYFSGVPFLFILFRPQNAHHIACDNFYSSIHFSFLLYPSLFAFIISVWSASGPGQKGWQWAKEVWVISPFLPLNEKPEFQSVFFKTLFERVISQRFLVRLRNSGPVCVKRTSQGLFCAPFFIVLIIVFNAFMRGIHSVLFDPAAFDFLSLPSFGRDWSWLRMALDWQRP